MQRCTNRRMFLRDGLLVSFGACAGAAAPWFLRTPAAVRLRADDNVRASGFEQRLGELGIDLPAPAKPVAVYVPAIVTGNLLFTAGHIPRTADGQLVTGRVGDDLSLEQGAAAARLVGLHVLSTVRSKLGSLNRVVRLVKVLGMVNCTTDFTQQSQVINGFSELLVDVFGETAGKAGRSAVGVGSLPLNVPVEIEAIFEIVPETR